MNKLRNMILRKFINTTYDMQHVKRYSNALAKPLSQLFNQPKSTLKFFIKNQTVSNLFMLIYIIGIYISTCYKFFSKVPI